MNQVRDEVIMSNNFVMRCPPSPSTPFLHNVVSQGQVRISDLKLKTVPTKINFFLCLNYLLYSYSYSHSNVCQGQHVYLIMYTVLLDGNKRYHVVTFLLIVITWEFPFQSFDLDLTTKGCNLSRLRWSLSSCGYLLTY